MLGSPQLPYFFLKSDMFMRVRVRVNSTEVLASAGGLVLPLGCNANVVFTVIANVVWVHVKLDSFKRSPKAHLVEKVECLDGSKRYLSIATCQCFRGISKNFSRDSTWEESIIPRIPTINGKIYTTHPCSV